MLLLLATFDPGLGVVREGRAAGKMKERVEGPNGEPFWDILSSKRNSLAGWEFG
jgi:hypothetical protein